MASSGNPSISPVYGRITSEYGWRRHPLTYAREFHEARHRRLVMDPDRGNCDGSVTFSGYKYGYGWTVVVTHDSGLRPFMPIALGWKRIREMKSRERRYRLRRAIGYRNSPHLHYEVRLWDHHRSVKVPA